MTYQSDHVNKSQSVVDLAELAYYVFNYSVANGDDDNSYDHMPKMGDGSFAYISYANDGASTPFNYNQSSSLSGMVVGVFLSKITGNIIVSFQGTTYNGISTPSTAQQAQDLLLASGSSISTIMDSVASYVKGLIPALEGDDRFDPSHTMVGLNNRIIFTGHSLGAAEASFAEVYLESNPVFGGDQILGESAVGFSTPEISSNYLFNKSNPVTASIDSSKDPTTYNVINIDGTADFVPAGTMFRKNQQIGYVDYLVTPVAASATLAIIDKYASLYVNDGSALGTFKIVNGQAPKLRVLYSALSHAHSLPDLISVLQSQASSSSSSSGVFNASDVVSSTSVPLSQLLASDPIVAQAQARSDFFTKIISAIGFGSGGSAATANDLLTAHPLNGSESEADLLTIAPSESFFNTMTSVLTFALPELSSQLQSLLSSGTPSSQFEITSSPDGNGIVFDNANYVDSFYPNGGYVPNGSPSGTSASSNPFYMEGGGYAVKESDIYSSSNHLIASSASHLRFALQIDASGKFYASTSYSSDYEYASDGTPYSSLNSNGSPGGDPIGGSSISGDIDMSTGVLKDLSVFKTGVPQGTPNPFYGYYFSSDGSEEIRTSSVSNRDTNQSPSYLPGYFSLPASESNSLQNDQFYDPNGNALPNSNTNYPNNGSNTYSFRKGQGSLYIKDIDITSSSDKDVLLLSNIPQSDVGVVQGPSNQDPNSSSYSMSLRINDTGEIITIYDQFLQGTKDGVEEIDFGDGSVLTSDQFANWVATHQGLIAGTSGNDSLMAFGGSVLSGGAGNDVLSADTTALAVTASITFIGGVGNDTLVGGRGSDLYQYASGDGNDVIKETGPVASGKSDRLQFTDLAMKDLSFSKASDALVLTVKSSGSTVTIQNQYTDDGTGNGTDEGVEDFMFSGTLYTRARIDSLLTAFTAGPVQATPATSGNDSIAGTIYADSLFGAAGNDTINGLGGDNRLRGGTGNDILNGGGDNDTFLFSVGDGVDVVNDLVNDGPQQDFSGLTGDVIKFDTYGSSTVVSPSTVTFSQSGSPQNGTADNDLVIHFGTSDQITLAGWAHDLESPTSQVANDTIVFSDSAGTTMTALAADRLAMIVGASTGDTINGSFLADSIFGGAGNDSLWGYGGDDLIRGGTGNDQLYGGDGNDKYFFQVGDGFDIVGDLSNTGSNGSGGDQIVFAPSATAASNVSSSQATFSQGTDSNGKWTLVMNYGSGGDLVKMEQWIEDVSANQTANDSIVFQDATMTAQQAVAKSMIGGSGSDVIHSSVWNDLMTGGAGKDTFSFNAGFGKDTITDFTPSGASADVIDLSSSIYASYSAMTSAGAIHQSGSDTLISTSGTDSITLKNVTASSLSSADFAFHAQPS